MLNTRTGTDLSTRADVVAEAAVVDVAVLVVVVGSAAVVVGAAVVVRAAAGAAAGADVVVVGEASVAVSSESEPPREAAPRPANRIARAISTIAIARSGGPDDSGFGVVTVPTLIGPSDASRNEVTTAASWRLLGEGYVLRSKPRRRAARAF